MDEAPKIIKKTTRKYCPREILVFGFLLRKKSFSDINRKNKKQFILEVPVTFYCPVLNRLKRFGVDLRRCVGPRPVRYPGPLLYLRPKYFQ